MKVRRTSPIYTAQRFFIDGQPINGVEIEIRTSGNISDFTHGMIIEDDEAYYVHNGEWIVTDENNKFHGTYDDEDFIRNYIEVIDDPIPY